MRLFTLSFDISLFRFFMITLCLIFWYLFNSTFHYNSLPCTCISTFHKSFNACLFQHFISLYRNCYISFRHRIILFPYPSISLYFDISGFLFTSSFDHISFIPLSSQLRTALALLSLHFDIFYSHHLFFSSFHIRNAFWYNSFIWLQYCIYSNKSFSVKTNPSFP